MSETATENKVQFNLKNVYYAVFNETAGTYGTPVAVKGAVSLSLDPEGETKPFYADGVKYYTSISNNGYSGDLEMALITLAMKKDIFGVTEDSTDHVITENATVEPKKFALLFQIDGDQQAALNVMYMCSATRPAVGSKTNEDGKEVQTQKCKIEATPDANGKVMASTTASTPETVKSAWFTSVYGVTGA